MYELTPLDDVHLLEAVLDEVLYSLHVMVGHLLDFLHLGCILGCHVPVDVPECLKLRVVEIRELRKWNFAQCDEILDLHADAVLDERVLAEVFSKWFCLTRIASIDRRYRQK